MLKSRSPLRTSWPSFTCARTSSPPTCALIDTTLYASTVPIAWIWTGISLLSTVATATGTGGRLGACCACLDSALPPEHAAVRASTTAGSTADIPRGRVIGLLSLWQKMQREQEGASRLRRGAPSVGRMGGHFGAPHLNNPSAQGQAQTLEVEVDDGSRVQRQELGHDEPAHDREPEGTAQLAAGAEIERERQTSEERGHGGHHDRTEPQKASFGNRLEGGLPAAALGVDREVDHHDRVLLHQPDQQQDADQRDHVERGAE